MGRDRLVTTKEAADILAVTIGETARLCREGILNAKRADRGNAWLIDLESVYERKRSVRIARKPLTLKEAIQAANLYLSGDYSLTELSRLFGTKTQETIKNAWERYSEQLPMRQINAMLAWWKLTNGQAKLSPRKVKLIRRMREEGCSQRKIARTVKIDRKQVRRVLAGDAWSWVP